MPRKAKRSMELVIQPMSGAADTTVGLFIDDFTGETRQMVPQVVQPMRPVRTYAMIKRAAQRSKAKQANNTPQQHLARAIEFVQRWSQPTQRNPAQPGEHSIALGERLTIILPAKPWRRI